MAARAPRRAGFRFETASPPLDEVLPRMDVAVFAGFAQSGPPNIPVAVDGPAQFEAIFGGELRLAWDRARGRWATAHLARAVGDFFRNGGRRCWVIRLAGEEARANCFAVPGLLQLSLEGLQPAFALARSEGSWSDSITAGAALLATTVAAAVLTADPLVVSMPVGSLLTGDLLRLTWREAGIGAFATVGSLEEATKARLEARVWFRDPMPEGVIDYSSPPVLEIASASVAGGTVRCMLAGAPAAGSMLMIDAGEAQVWFRVAATKIAAEGAASPPGGLVEACGPGLWALKKSQPVPAGDPWAEKLSFELWARDPGRELLRITDLAFDPTHARFWGGLPSDAVLHTGAQAGALWAEASAPNRFPLACAGGALAIPAGMELVPSQFSGAYSTGEPALKRDGLETFDWRLFLDKGLRETGLTDLLDTANSILYTGSSPKLKGIHAALTLEEATIIAAPDAIHAGWKYNPWSPPEAEQAPPAVSRAGPGGVFVDCSPAAPAPPEEVETEKPATGRGRYELLGTFSDGTLIEVDRALLRMCAARGDMLALLALPESYREDEAAKHIAALRSVRADERAFSYGAVYHPWVIRRAAEGLVSAPPDGVAAGVLAARALARGAWIAPANERLRGLVALAPGLAGNSPAGFATARVNLVEQTARGFVVLSEDTLSEDPDLRLINVRRLLTLLRRLALRLGSRWVFEPNSDAFRRLVQRNFESLLGMLFERGAFAGGTPGTSYQVATGDDLNTQASLDQGRFIVELRVAPSLPMSFITIRLMQTGERTSVAEVA